MPLAVNGERIDANKTRTPYKDYQRRVGLLEQLGSNVQFESIPYGSKEEVERSKQSIDHVPKVNVRMSATYIGEAGEESVTYYSSQRSDPTHGTVFRPTHQMISGTKILDMKQHRDLIYYLLFISPSCELVGYQDKGIELADKIRAEQNQVKRRQPRYRLVVDQFAAVENLRNSRIINEATSMITSAKVLGDDRVKDVMFSLGMTVDPDMDINRSRLLSRIMAPDRSTGKPNLDTINEFMERTKLEGMHAAQAMVNKAISQNIISLKQPTPGKSGSWMSKDPDGKFTNTLTSVTYSGGRPENQLITLIHNDAHLRGTLENLIIEEAGPKKSKGTGSS